MTDHSGKWSAHKTIGFLLLSSAGLWIALGLAVRSLFH